jgi:hypothetical protein
MQIHSIPTPSKQKSQDMGLSDLNEEEIKLLAMEYNTKILNLITNLITM